MGHAARGLDAFEYVCCIFPAKCTADLDFRRMAWQSPGDTVVTQYVDYAEDVLEETIARVARNANQRGGGVEKHGDGVQSDNLMGEWERIGG